MTGTDPRVASSRVNARVLSFALIALGLLVVVEASGLPLVSGDAPGPGFVPLLIGLLMTLLAGIGVLVERNPVLFGDLRRGLAIPAGLIPYGILLEGLGYVISTVLLMAYLFRIFNPRFGVRLSALAIVSSVLTYAFFRGVLQLQLPPDPWDLWR